MNTKTILVKWTGSEVYPSYRLEDLTNNPDLGLVLSTFSGESVVDNGRGNLERRVTISKGIYGERLLQLVAIDAEGESTPSGPFAVVLNRDLPEAPGNLEIT